MSEAAALSPSEEAEFEAALRQAQELRRAQLRENLPEWLDVDENENVVPAEGYVWCPTCGGQGATKPEFPVSPKYLTCPTCGGLGMAGTGSLVKGQEAVPCPDCNGNGWVDRQNWEATHPG